MCACVCVCNQIVHTKLRQILGVSMQKSVLKLLSAFGQCLYTKMGMSVSSTGHHLHVNEIHNFYEVACGICQTASIGLCP